VSDPRLIDFAYPGDEGPTGVFERGMPEEIVEAIAEHATFIAASLGPRARDCLWACPAWERRLKGRGVEVRTLGGVGIDDEVFDAAYRSIPLDRRSGYREDDGQIHQHWWLAVGTESLVFDPTGHQFDDKGGISLDGYVIDGEPWIDQRIADR
jgi:hypothetical protein